MQLAVCNQNCQLEVKVNDIIIRGGVSNILKAKPRVPLSSTQVAVVELSGTCTR